MKHCRCEVPRPSSNPRRKDCNRCGFRIPEPEPKPPARPLVYHCARCHEELRPGHQGAMWSELLRMPGGDLVCDHFARFCAPCTAKILELVLQLEDGPGRVVEGR